MFFHTGCRIDCFQVSCPVEWWLLHTVNDSFSSLHLIISDLMLHLCLTPEGFAFNPDTVYQYTPHSQHLHQSPNSASEAWFVNFHTSNHSAWNVTVFSSIFLNLNCLENWTFTEDWRNSVNQTYRHSFIVSVWVLLLHCEKKQKSHFLQKILYPNINPETMWLIKQNIDFPQCNSLYVLILIMSLAVQG